MDSAKNAGTTSSGAPGAVVDHVIVNAQDGSGSPSALSTLRTMSSNPLPVNVYETLLLKLVTVLGLTHQPEGTTTPAAKQHLLQATNDFKSSLAHAKDLVSNLPGGELLIEDQDEVIQMLETLRNRKREQLERFSRHALQSSTVSAAEQKIEIDSMASTPANE